MSKNPDIRLPCTTCTMCGGLLEIKTFCTSCDGAGGWGNWLETGDDTCVNCNGSGDPQPGESPSIRDYCPKCSLIYPPNNLIMDFPNRL